ncbi:MAG: polysaccharide deacetylase family protein [Gammaproteobacteria bacterium]|nr:polysaccharide deacetylase family protein [Gammaproteobacteria bacterium]
MWRILTSFILFTWALNANAAVILQYHHVSDTTPASTSISVESFRIHMNYLTNNNYNVIKLSDILGQIKHGNKLPPKTVAITFDDGYLNVLTNADPILKQHSFPYTLFISANEISKQHAGMLSWQQIEGLAQSGVDIANHSSDHLHLNRKFSDESIKQWQTRITQDLANTEQQILEHTQQSHKMLAYPYGEYNTQLQQLVTKLGYIGIGQHSGALWEKSDFSAIPRFPASGRFSNIETLAIKLQSLAMPVTQLVNANSQLDQHATTSVKKRPVLTVTLDPADVDTRQLYCYILGQRVEPKWLDKTRFSISSPTDLPAGRSRYNCTAPSLSQSGYYWFSQPWINRNADGTWYQQ